MSNIVLILAIATAVSATGFVVIALLWLRKLRLAVAVSLQETANQQIRTATFLNDNLSQIQKKQELLEQQVQKLAEANAQLQQDFSDITSEIEMAESEELSLPLTTDRTVH